MTTATCGARTRSGGQCGRPAGWGTVHVGTGRCRLHGWNTPTHQRAHQLDQARQVTRALGIPVDVDPHQALLDELHRTAGQVAALGEVVSGLEREQLVGGAVRTVRFPDGGRLVEARAGANVWVRLYQQERAHLVRVAKAAIDTGVAERQVAIVEQQAGQLAHAVAAILVDVGIDPGDERVRAAVRHRLAQAAARARRPGGGRGRLMPRESAEAKGRRMLVEGRLIVQLVDERKVIAACRGDSGEVYRLGFDPRTRSWRCTCPALTAACSHLHALRLVTLRPPGGSAP